MEINNNNYYYILPEEISIDILSRLPAVSVIRCSSIRKSWRNLIVYNRNFAREFPRMHLLRGLESHHHHGASASYNGRVNFLLLTDLGYNEGYQMYCTLDDNNYEEMPESKLRVLRSNLNPYNNKDYYVVGSCNGLICMSYNIGKFDDSDSGFEEPIYICNPITREWLTLPSLTIKECCSYCSDNDPTSVRWSHKVVCGFGYLSSTDEYKVVRITYCRNRGYYVVYGRVQVYTLGNGNGWRDKGETSYLLGGHRNNLPSILANGALHWLEENEGEIVAFDLADEEFLILPSPPCFIPYDDEDKYSIQIQVLGGQLCTAFHDDENLTVGVWFFKNENKERNGNYKDRNGRAEYQSWSWIKEFDIEWEGTGYFTPFILTENGDVLYYSWKSLFCYDLKTATSKVLLDMEKRLSDDFYCLEAIPHLNSFISLKALGEEDTKIIIDQSQGRTTA